MNTLGMKHTLCAPGCKSGLVARRRGGTGVEQSRKGLGCAKFTRCCTGKRPGEHPTRKDHSVVPHSLPSQPSAPSALGHNNIVPHALGQRGGRGSKSPRPNFDTLGETTRLISFREASGTKARGDKLRLFNSYDDTVGSIVAEIDNTHEGDHIEFSVYVLEPGASTQAVLAAMRRAAARDVDVACSLDCSITSEITRWFEHTTTLASELRELEKEYPGHVKFKPQSLPTHAKYLMCHRAHAESTAVFGGVNIGDRFRSWKDFAIRAEGNDLVSSLAASLSSAPITAERPMSTFALRIRAMVLELIMGVASSGVGGEQAVKGGVEDCGNDGGGVGMGVRFVTNLPTAFDPVAWVMPWSHTFPGKYDVRKAIEMLLQDRHYDSYTIAMAYVDSCGARLLSCALARGASVRLVMPQTPNVYHDANRKALAPLVKDHGQAGGLLDVRFLPGMLHAKAVQAHGPGGISAAMVGSCNLKRRSFGQFAELNAFIADVEFNRKLEMEMKLMFEEALPIDDKDLRYWEPKATIEEWLG